MAVRSQGTSDHTAAQVTYNPHWPFPQFDGNGRQLLPDGWNKRVKRQAPSVEEFGEALM
jgi:hypothetical protein